MVKEANREEAFRMVTEYWEVKITEGNALTIRFEVSFKSKVIPRTELTKLEDAIRKILEACGRLEPYSPSKR